MWAAPIYETPTSKGSAAAAAKSSPAVDTLYVSESTDDYQWKKVAVVAEMVGVSLNSVQLEDDEFASLMPEARSCVLVTASGMLTQTNTILRYLATLRPDVGLLGATEFDEAKVDQWAEFCWFELECLVGALTMPQQKGEPPFDPAQVKAVAAEDTAKSLAALNVHLGTTTFLAGQRPSLADVCVVCTLQALMAKLVGDSLLGPYPALARWFQTCLHTPSFKAVIGPVKLSGVAKPVAVVVPGAAKAAAGKAGAAAGGGASKPSIPPPPPLFERKRTRIVELLREGASAIGKTVTVKGWARTVRKQKDLSFITLTDGSGAGDLQVVVDKIIPGWEDTKPGACGGTGSSWDLEGTVVASKGGNQAVELQATKCTLLGKVMDNTKYPMAKKGHTAEHLRKHAHLRPRARVYAAVQRVRNAMAYATHKFFYDRGFLYVHTPLITGADCEGAGEMFSVTTLLPQDPKEDIPRTKDGKIDYEKDFFSKPASLTVSGQLNVETHACALSDCYTFGPTFRAENSHTARHLAEFWMIEPEIAFAGLQEDMDLAEDYLKFCVHYALTECADDLALLEAAPDLDPELRPRLHNLIERPFTRKTYTECIEILESEIAAGNVTFEQSVEWGMDMESEHERYLAEKIFNGPLICTNYPKGIKAFYMKLNEDGKTVGAMDILVPRIGEIIGGSVREDRYETLIERAQEVGVQPEDLDWYLDLRKYGTVPHAGFGLGFERLIMLVTGVKNIRDVIPFPRVPGNCDF